jgi:hypothetical protein
MNSATALMTSHNILNSNTIPECKILAKNKLRAQHHRTDAGVTINNGLCDGIKVGGDIMQG